MKRRIHFQIPQDRAGVPLLDFLASRFPYHSRDGWAERCADGRVLVNDEPATPERILAYRDRIDYVTADVAEPAVSFDVGIIYDDADILVVNKPPNLPCHPGGRYFHHTLWAWVRREAGLAEPIFVNRIDRETSGLVVIARTPPAGKRCRGEFVSRRVEKHYVALVEGEFPEAVTAEGWLVPDGEGPVRKRRRFVPGVHGEPAPPDSQWAVTRFRRVAVRGGLSEVAVLLETGRLHQIRATLLALGFPLVGDKLYGGDPGIFLRFCTGTMTDADHQRLRLPRQALHAERLVFRHPRTRCMLDLHTALPADMRALRDAATVAEAPAARDGRQAVP